jgi:hypothetical protein
MIINPCNKGNLLCKKLIFYNSTYEEDKPVIHKLNQTIIISFIHLEETRYG